MAERLVESEPQEKVYTKITPDHLLPRNRLIELKDRLHETPQWRKLQFAEYDQRGIRLSIGDLVVVVPLVHYLLGMNDIALRKNFKGRKNRFLTTELQLHNASSLFDLLRRGKTNEEEVLNSFPNSSDKEVHPFVDALSLGDQGVEDVWKRFQKNSGVEDNQNFGLGIHLANSPSGEVNRNTNDYYDAAGVFNFGKFPGEQDTRIQFTVQFGKVESTPSLQGNTYRYNFSELTTRSDIDHAVVFQALTRSYLAGYFRDRFFDGGILERTAEPYIAYGVNGLTQKCSDQELVHRHFDTISYSITNIPVQIDHYGDGGVYFIRQWLGFYSDAFNAFKKELRKYLTDGTVPEISGIQRELPFVFDDGRSTYIDLSNIPPAGPKKENPCEVPLYIVGESFAKEKCPTCHQSMTQYCQPRVDMGGDWIKIRVQLVCQGHFFSSKDMNVKREYLKYKDPNSSENKH